MLSTMQKPPHIVAVSETKINKNDGLSFPTIITGYNFLHSDSEKKSGGVGIYIDSSISYYSGHIGALMVCASLLRNSQ